MRTPNIQLSIIAKLTLLCISLLFIPVLSHAKDVSFSWTANASDAFTGYKLYYKTGPDNAPPYEGTGLIEGDSPILLGRVTTTTVTGLSENVTYQFTITAYSDELESEYSTVALVESVTMPSPVINIMSQN